MVPPKNLGWNHTHQEAKENFPKVVVIVISNFSKCQAILKHDFGFIFYNHIQNSSCIKFILVFCQTSFVELAFETPSWRATTFNLHQLQGCAKLVDYSQTFKHYSTHFGK